MASETLHFDNARQAQSLYANEPKNLRLVEDLLDLKVTARDGWINIEGAPGDIERAKSLFTNCTRPSTAARPFGGRNSAAPSAPSRAVSR